MGPLSGCFHSKAQPGGCFRQLPPPECGGVTISVYVTGAVALMFENSPGLMDGGTDMLDDLKQWIVDSSLMRPGQEDHDDHYGYGLLQVDALISASQGDTT